METIKSRDMIVVREYRHNDISVFVEINYLTNNISLVERKGYEWVPKKYLFAGREIAYMTGWINILEAMKKSVEAARDDLSAYQEKSEEDRYNAMVNVLSAAEELNDRPVASYE